MYAAKLGAMQMPAGFKYRDIFMRGRPRHEKYDSFYIKHPPMPASRWAKIFAPFDALDGFDERIQSKTVLYEEKRRLSEGEIDELNRKLCRLHDLTRNGRLARKNRPAVTITYFSPCTDIENDWYGTGGKYEEISGTVLNVEMGSIRLRTEDGERTISFSDIRDIN